MEIHLEVIFCILIIFKTHFVLMQQLDENNKIIQSENCSDVIIAWKKHEQRDFRLIKDVWRNSRGMWRDSRQSPPFLCILIILFSNLSMTLYSCEEFVRGI